MSVSASVSANVGVSANAGASVSGSGSANLLGLVIRVMTKQNTSQWQPQREPKIHYISSARLRHVQKK